jgi:hypothetical protein
VRLLKNLDNMKQKYIYLIIVILLLTFSFSGCVGLQKVLQNPRYTYEDGALLVGGDDEPILLNNNSDAVDTTYSEVLDFIRQDGTDQLVYISRDSDTGAAPFVCSDFAEILHNNAESAGIRAAYLSIDFADGSIGHAINAFQTTDKGLINIDCTGQSVFSQLEDEASTFVFGSWDKVAYIEIGQKYGIIGLEEALSPDYTFYLEYDQKWQEYRQQLTAYNTEVKRYNQEIAGKVFRQGSPELAAIKEMESRLIAQEKALEELHREIGPSRFKPLGVVRSTFIHW